LAVGQREQSFFAAERATPTLGAIPDASKKTASMSISLDGFAGARASHPDALARTALGVAISG
jgi:hypothetical protein